jgi:hypothetical protein
MLGSSKVGAWTLVKSICDISTLDIWQNDLMPLEYMRSGCFFMCVANEGLLWGPRNRSIIAFRAASGTMISLD